MLLEYWIFIIINDTSCAAIVRLVLLYICFYKNENIVYRIGLYFFVVEKNHVAKVLNSLVYVTVFCFDVHTYI